MLFETFSGLLLWIQNTTSKCSSIKKYGKQNTKPSTSPTEITPENRESETKKNIREFIPNPMPTDVAVAKDHLDPGKMRQ